MKSTNVTYFDDLSHVSEHEGSSGMAALMVFLIVTGMGTYYVYTKEPFVFILAYMWPPIIGLIVSAATYSAMKGRNKDPISKEKNKSTTEIETSNKMISFPDDPFPELHRKDGSEWMN